MFLNIVILRNVPRDQGSQDSIRLQSRSIKALLFLVNKVHSVLLNIWQTIAKNMEKKATPIAANSKAKIVANPKHKGKVVNKYMVYEFQANDCQTIKMK